MKQRRRRSKPHSPKPSRPKHPKSYKIVCAGCGKEFAVPVPPPDDKKLLCIDCFSNKDI